MTTYTIATARDMRELKGNLRKVDKREIWAVSHEDPDEALANTFYRSAFAWAMRINGDIAALFGASPFLPNEGVGIPWLLASDLFTNAGMGFARRSHGFLATIFGPFCFLFNYVDSRNKRSLKWLRWCGFTVEPSQPYGIDGLPFNCIWMRRDQLCVPPV